MSSFIKQYHAILEGMVNKKHYQFIVTFHPAPENIRKQLKKVLEMLSQFHSSITTIKETKSDEIVYTIESPDKWNLGTEDERNKFARAFYNSCGSIMAQFRINVPYTARYKTKYEDLTNRMPELNGLFD